MTEIIDFERSQEHCYTARFTAQVVCVIIKSKAETAAYYPHKMRIRGHNVPELCYCNINLRCFAAPPPYGGHQNIVLMKFRVFQGY